MNSALTINELIRKRGDTPAIIAGDFNATPDSRPIREFEKEWKMPLGGPDDASRSVTFPAEKPDRWIDYIMYRPADKWEVVEVRVLDEPVASDHRPVLAVLRLKNGGSATPQIDQADISADRDRQSATADGSGTAADVPLP